MAGYIKVEVEKIETKQINTLVNAKIFEKFQKKCKERNLQMCTVIETFLRQYSKNRYKLDREDVLKWKMGFGETTTLSTPVNKEVYDKFKDKVKANGYFVKHILMAFIEDYAKKDLVLEFKQTNNRKSKKRKNIKLVR